jgi:hypothetical protein
MDSCNILYHNNMGLFASSVFKSYDHLQNHAINHYKTASND